LRNKATTESYYELLESVGIHRYPNEIVGFNVKTDNYGHATSIVAIPYNENES
jgi:hypothetical protein